MAQGDNQQQKGRKLNAMTMMAELRAILSAKADGLARDGRR